MHDISKSRYLKILAVEAEREGLMAGMMKLMSEHEHLSRERAELESAPGALQVLGSLMGTMEDRNKKLSRESGDLWQAIMDLDGKELTSEEIEREERVIAEALRWLERIKRRLAKEADLEGSFDALMNLSDLERELSRRKEELADAHVKCQHARAELLCRDYRENAN